MSARNKALLLGLLGLLLLLGLFASPYLTLHQMRRAAQAQNAQGLSEHVDWPSLRDSLKTGVQARLAQQDLNEQGQPSRAAAWGAAVAGALLGPLVDSLITPQSLGRLLQGQSPGAAALGFPPPSPAASEPGAQALEWSSHFEGINRFVFSLRKPGAEEDPIHLVLRREGLLGWKLAELRLP
ncbi:hypothetical protein HNP55_001020 [Paucibacter oligotrophus]|uniref:DUF2939 family protein n=1 Tax=Roseateles oligotrophus TaxID=1769250 RepID=A0A840L780_9BURK|nr:DUF2939 domain-containing protein [Roseateles oligotrophus]MBB4842505.1 hypothetical protein [Roseateles oligotrophus]